MPSLLPMKSTNFFNRYIFFSTLFSGLKVVLKYYNPLLGHLRPWWRQSTTDEDINDEMRTISLQTRALLTSSNQSMEQKILSIINRLTLLVILLYFALITTSHQRTQTLSLTIPPSQWFIYANELRLTPWQNIKSQEFYVLPKEVFLWKFLSFIYLFISFISTKGSYGKGQCWWPAELWQFNKIL